MTIHDPRPTDGPTAEILAEDLSLSNEEGLSWFAYRHGEEPDTILADLYTEDGRIEKTYTVRLTVEETPGSEGRRDPLPQAAPPVLRARPVHPAAARRPRPCRRRLTLEPYP